MIEKLRWGTLILVMDCTQDSDMQNSKLRRNRQRRRRLVFVTDKFLHWSMQNSTTRNSSSDRSCGASERGFVFAVFCFDAFLLHRHGQYFELFFNTLHVFVQETFLFSLQNVFLDEMSKLGNVSKRVLRRHLVESVSNKSVVF